VGLSLGNYLTEELENIKMNYSRKKEEDLILYLGKAFENKKYRIPLSEIEEDLDLSRDELSTIINVIHDRGKSFKIVGVEGQAVSILPPMVQKARKIEETRNKKITSQKEKWYHDTKFIIASILAVLGLLYGVTKDHKLRQIEKRANSPFFTISTIQVDSNGASYPSGGKPYYPYKQKPSELSARLWDMDEFEPGIPDNYPDNHPIGLLLKNTGAELRSFETTSREQMVFQEASLGKNLYELRYVYSKAAEGKKFRFTLTFETYEGFQDSQVWEVTKGAISIKRIKPKIP